MYCCFLTNYRFTLTNYRYYWLRFSKSYHMGYRLNIGWTSLKLSLKYQLNIGSYRFVFIWVLPKDLSSPMIIKLWTFFEFQVSMWYAFKSKTRGPTHLNRIGRLCICFQQIWLNCLCFGILSIMLTLYIFFSQNIWL